ncbi:MAG: hypothetical protein IH895_03075, partial [Planctomycetes bacterium]|nr:hypothetical protein [Planctomycetota bacterium]
MGDNDWYRQKRWGEGQRNSFFERLGRSRTDFNKAQYCRIQALHLQETGKTDALRGAVELLNRILEQYPDECTQLASVYLQKAQCCEDVGRAEEAIENFRYCIDYQRQFPHCITNAALEFGVFVLRHEFSDLHEEVLSVLDEFPCDSAFPPPDDLDAAKHAEWRKAHRWSPNRLRHSAAT